MTIRGSVGAGTRDPLWYKDAVIYETHVKAFFDSNADGFGDFPGLIQKLDYVQALGATCIWLLPFFPSPQYDDGYDIADFADVHPFYGTLRDFMAFVGECHRRHIRVIVELVINHTSDQHPWFQRARLAPAGSEHRNYYVWDDTGTRYQAARIIFSGSEKSNWTWDPVAGAYFWHRFYSRQPDLNFDNPVVVGEVLKIVRFWLDLGVDGLRLDAVPYLVERDGTTCENLPETHAVIKRIRRMLDQEYPDRILLAEVNQWPDAIRPYFGDGDECHMAFHFPLMPRLFMALRLENRYPIVEILGHTPAIPDTCQWALFLRSHDALTLSKLSQEERDYMFVAYGGDPQMRLHSGIRRRLASLVDNDRRRLELLYSLLFSLPGTPILYYGDEIGMGDNVYLGDRFGLRTPMQWNDDRAAGFSTADWERLYGPPVMNPVYGYHVVNVRAQERQASSLLNWIRRMIALRQRCSVFGRGSFDFVATSNPRVLAYVRRYEGDLILCVGNLARTSQPCELDLTSFRGRTPVEMIGETPFPRIGEHPYFLSLSPHAYYWFSIDEPER